MVTVLKTEDETHILSDNLQKTIRSIREIVGNHSDSEIYNALKECNMDPNETAQKLLHQDTFHEVRRRRDKKKENALYNGYVEPRKRMEYFGQGEKFYGFDRNARRGGYTRSSVNDARTSREFRVVRDNRVNQISDRETKAPIQVPVSANVQQSNDSEKSESLASNTAKNLVGRYVQTLNGLTDFRPKPARDIISKTRREHMDEGKVVGTGYTSKSKVSVMKSDTQSQSGSPAISNAVGVYASASDPVHVPTSDSRSSAAIGAIRREVGVVGGQRSSTESSSKQPFQQSISNLNSVLGNSSTTESFRTLHTGSRNDQSRASVVESTMISSAGSRLGSHFGGKLHHHVNKKGVLPSKEWKPKTSQKSSVPSPGVIGSPVKSASKPSDTSGTGDREVDQLEDKLSQVNIIKSQNVIIAQHIRVPENDRCVLTFGSFSLESVSAENSASAFQAPESVEEEGCEPSPSNKQIIPDDDQAQNSGSSTPSGVESENQLREEKGSSVLPNAENYVDMGSVQNSSSFTDSKSQQHQDPTELPNFSTYDPQPVYDIPYFRPHVDDAVHGPGLPSPQEALSSHTANSIPASSIAMIQQQAPMAQMYPQPQVHLSHYANVMPYRQYITPMYVPSMVTGYSGSPGYTHVSNGSSYVLMPGGSSHLPANNHKYGVQQFKPLPAGSPTGFGNFVNPAGYAVSAPGVVGGPTGLDESSRIKYKDSSLYVQSPQAETSEVWIQNHRELAGMQSTPYFNMQGQTAHPAYLQSHNGHTSFNAAAAAVAQQSSHMQFPGMYPSQPAAIPNAHHLGGVGVAPPAPGAQVGGYQQQPQISHLNWTTNF